jgi:hypothetical protein
MALEIEDVVDGGVHAEKPLGGASRLELLHFALPPTHCLMLVFRRGCFSAALAHVGGLVSDAGARRRKSAAYR